MEDKVIRSYVEKNKGFDVEAQKLYREFREILNIKSLTGVRLINRYDISGINKKEYMASRSTIFSEPTVDEVYDEQFEFNEGDRIFVMEYLPGQYDQRADSAVQCIQILTQSEKPLVQTAKVIVLEGDITEAEFSRVKNYCINPVDSREARQDKPISLDMSVEIPADVEIVKDFILKSTEELKEYREIMGFAMSLEDIKFCQAYFRDIEKRNPSITEIKVIDTYWSDHCRHTTFLTEIKEVCFENTPQSKTIKKAYKQYIDARKYVYQEQNRDMCLMDMAVMGMKVLRKQGKLEDLDESDEVNACSIVVGVDVDGNTEDWLVMFKNETHNHPTEIEPFGGAATCLGGAIRDPLSGRTYVYQAMRVTGSGDPRTPLENTLTGKLPQRKITTEAAAGYSSYGNQIGLATGQVAEIYDNDYVAKRMEIGAVVAAAPRRNVIRNKPQPGDVVVLLGGKTGRDGCGGATGSSKEHTEESLFDCGAEVQKGNAPTERKIQRLFRNPKVSRMIKKCNDFGAGGVAVAIGELTDSLEINLDFIPKKYEGLDGTELAISESQERMAVVLDSQDAAAFIEYAGEENLEAVPVAKVTSDGRLKMNWRGITILDISREFLNTNGVKQHTSVFVNAPDEDSYFNKMANDRVCKEDIKTAWLQNLQDLNVASQRGLAERFDSTIGAGTVLLPFGGKYQSTPAEGMVSKIPVLCGDTTTATMMAYGFNPKLSKWSPFHGAFYAVIEAVTKIVAMGGDYRKIRLTLQEYFEKLGEDPKKWGKPFSALLGAFSAQLELGIPAIGGKDSMSGTFKDMNVPPTLVAFAVDVVDASQVISQEFKQIRSNVVLIPVRREESQLPDMKQLKMNFERITKLIHEGTVLAAHSIRFGGLAGAISKMCFGNKIGIKFDEPMDSRYLFVEDYGSIILEIDESCDVFQLIGDIPHKILGQTQQSEEIEVNGTIISLSEALACWEKPLEKIFPTHVELKGEPKEFMFKERGRTVTTTQVAKPRILIPVFPGTNCEYDTSRAFEIAGGQVETLVFRNLTTGDVEESIENLKKMIEKSQIIAIPGGFSGGDEPDGSGKFIATVFRNDKIKEAVLDLLYKRDGLMIGICNGFQALIKLGLLPYGDIREIKENDPTLTFNTIGRHMSKMVQTKVVSVLSPWFNNIAVGDIHTIALSHGEGRFVASGETITELAKTGQIATQYVDFEGKPTYDIVFNPNGSIHAIEGITSPDGRILGKMGHSERVGTYVGKNIHGNKEQKIFEAGVKYFL